MKQLLLIALSLLFLYGCGGNRNTAQGCTIIIVSEFQNEYDEYDELIRVIQTEMLFDANGFFVEQTQYEHIHTVSPDTVRIDVYEYRNNRRGVRLRSEIFCYVGRTMKEIEWQRNGTARSTHLMEFDEDIMHLIRREFHESYNFIDTHYEMRYIRDSLGRFSQIIFTCFTEQSVDTVKFFYNTPPTLTPTDHLTIIFHQEEMVGDTLVTTSYRNGALCEIIKEFENGNRKTEKVFDAEGNMTDKWVRYNDNEVKTITVFSEFRDTITREFDEFGNVVRERNCVWFFD